MLKQGPSMTWGRKPVCTLEGHQLIRHWQIHTPSCCDSSVWQGYHLHVSPWVCRWRHAIRSHDGGCGLDQVCGAAACRPLGLGMASHDRWWWWRRRDGNDNDDDNGDWRRTTDNGRQTTTRGRKRRRRRRRRRRWGGDEEEMRRRWGGGGDEGEMRRRWGGGGDDDDDDDNNDGWRMTDAGWWMMDGGSMMDDRWPMVDDRWSMMILQSHHCQKRLIFLFSEWLTELYYFFLRFAPRACASQKEPDFEVIMARARTRREPKEKLFSFYQGKNAALGGFS